MEAGHFDTKTAYAAANTLRLDDMNPHFWRTHDGGKIWTEIDNGIAGGAVANSIREDPRKKGLLYAATDTQVWVSFDDGDHWHSLRLNMPAISVRDIEVKDDASCLCSDLVAGTHGRGFWILDNVTPLRQAAEAAAASSAYLFKPATGIRIRFGTNDPTPWPPELQAGENPPPGAMVDYYLPGAANEVKLEILNAQGKVIRTYSSKDQVLSPDPAIDPAAYNQICQQTPTAQDCNLPLYWPAPQQILKTSAGMHRFSWDMHYDPIPGAGGGGRGGGGGNGAVPHRTYPGVNAPWVAPGAYSVRLTVDGKSLTQPITIKMDPRVKITPEVQEIFTLTTRMENNARSAEGAYKDARALAEKLKSRPQSAANDALIKEVEAIAPVEIARAENGGGRGGRGGGRGFGGPVEPPVPPNLSNIGARMVGAVTGMQASEMPPTATELHACAAAGNGVPRVDGEVDRAQDEGRGSGRPARADRRKTITSAIIVRMTRQPLAGFLAAALLIGGAASSYAQQRKSSLTADDYFEIQQLYAQYNHSIDSGDAEGYAATFTPDGVFNTFSGHDALVGFIHRWRETMNGGNMRHWNSNLLIKGTPEGASGSVYLLLVNISLRPPVIATAAQYTDELVKTPEGWRFKKRVTKAQTPPPAAAPKP